MVNEDSCKPMNCPFPMDVGLRDISQSDASRWLKTTTCDSTAAGLDMSVFSQMFDLSADRGCIWIHQGTCNPMQTAAPTCGLLTGPELTQHMTALLDGYARNEFDIESIVSELSHVSLSKFTASPVGSRQVSVDRSDSDDIGNTSPLIQDQPVSSSPITNRSGLDVSVGSNLSEWLIGPHL